MESLFGFQAQGDVSVNSILFSRLAFLYWGSHLAANLIPPVFPIILLLKSENDKILVNNFFPNLFSYGKSYSNLFIWE